jgi:hypothetical protein
MSNYKTLMNCFDEIECIFSQYTTITQFFKQGETVEMESVEIETVETVETVEMETEEVETEEVENEEIIISNVDISQYFNKEYGGYDNKINICPQQQPLVQLLTAQIPLVQSLTAQKPIPEHLNMCWPLMKLSQYPLYDECYDKLY